MTGPSGATPTFAWPYPLGTDDSNGPADIQDLALAIENFLKPAAGGGKLLIVDGTGKASWLAMTGDATITNAGNLQIAAGAVVNADVATAAAIAVTKIANGATAQVLMTNGTTPTWQSVSGDITISATGVMSIGAAKVTSSMIVDGTIVAADIAAGAAIALSQLASGTSAQIPICNVSGVPTYVGLTGDITVSNAGVTAIGANKVTHAMLGTTLAPPPNVQTFLVGGSTTWTKPTAPNGCVAYSTVELFTIGGGAGGGGGARAATAAGAGGGGGGGSGFVIQATLIPSLCGATEAVAVGSGGAGAVAITTDTTNGNVGSNGGSSSFGGSTIPIIQVAGGQAGTGGSFGGAGGVGGSGASGGAGGAASSYGAGGSGAITSHVPSDPSSSPGGGGGGCTGSGGNVGADAGSHGAAGGGVVATGQGGSGATSVSAGAVGAPIPGAGGNGASVAGNNGSVGVVYGGGGGGGSGRINGSTAGAGGAGANGIVVVITR